MGRPQLPLAVQEQYRAVPGRFQLDPAGLLELFGLPLADPEQVLRGFLSLAACLSDG
jgi:hypothetical protein